MPDLGDSRKGRRTAPARARSLLFAAALGATLAFPAHAAATTYTPTTTADGNNGACTPALCTLRDAINEADLAPGNDVSIPAGTYTLNLGELDIDNVMTVAGAGARTTTIDAQGTSRVFAVNGPIGEALIRDVTITGGVAPPPGPGFGGEAGGILVDGELDLRRAAVIGNTATFAGGGVSAPFKSFATGVTIEDSLIANNRVAGGTGAATGGGLNLFAPATIVNSTITGNLAAAAVGDSQGGGVTSGDDLTLLNTTIAGNTNAGPAATSFGAGLSGDNFIALFPPLGIFPPAITQLTATNTIIAGNTVAGTAQDCRLVQAISTSFNLSGDASCGFTDSGSKQNADPKLGPLADNGGPTSTMALGEGSPALNTGINGSCPSADQRGIGRPQVEICDIGAFEAKGPDLSVEQQVKGKKGKKGATSAGLPKRKRVTFIATVSNKGEQVAPDARLVVKVSKATAKLRVKGCKSAGKGKKGRRKKGGRKKRGCELGALGPGETARVRIKVRPKAKTRGKIVSKVRIVGARDGDSSNNFAKTKVRAKRKRRG